jgi:hypothetical protein
VSWSRTASDWRKWDDSEPRHDDSLIKLDLSSGVVREKMWRVPMFNKVSIDDKFLTYWATEFAGDSLEKLVADLYGNIG